MTKTALVHIGTRKTGSTSIQAALAQAQKSGSIRPVCYPVPEGSLNHNLLAFTYRPRERIAPYRSSMFTAEDERARNMRRRYRELFFDELRGVNTAIISSENMMHFPSTVVQHLRQDLETVGFRKFYIVLYIRDPADYYLSNTYENLKKMKEIADPLRFRYPFLQITDTWEHVFPGTVIVRHFRSDPDYDVVQDFSTLLRKHLNISLRTPQRRFNTTISAEGMEILDQYRSILWKDGNVNYALELARLVRYLRSGGEVSQTKPALQPAIANRIRAHHRADAELVLSRYGVDLGIQDANSDGPLDHRGTYRVEDILQYFDPDVVIQLLLPLVRDGLHGEPRKRHPVTRIGARMYRMAKRGC